MAVSRDMVLKVAIKIMLSAADLRALGYCYHSVTCAVEFKIIVNLLYDSGNPTHRMLLELRKF